MAKQKTMIQETYKGVAIGFNPFTALWFAKEGDYIVAANKRTQEDARAAVDAWDARKVRV